ncbi:cysteine desulfurase [Vagococcus acidifermentans]|uniref:Cysteine desulfurase n=1 Tax=Vagococcus acidifermentans TaxID=564710 RepID=A0A430AVM5_9ENTE|nr:cysteine desulfurase [Vagococcus acidifermentans]RSU12105.1 cysteine desulfurase [Vagococcus acidifermentans]
MAFLKKAAVLGSNDYYEVNPQAKKYLFRDYGFKETASGNLQLIRPLDTNLQNKQSPKLKITVAEDLQTLKMSITTANGMKALNIFNSAAHQDKQEQFNYLMADMVHAGCLVKSE